MKLTKIYWHRVNICKNSLHMLQSNKIYTPLNIISITKVQSSDSTRKKQAGKFNLYSNLSFKCFAFA